MRLILTELLESLNTQSSKQTFNQEKVSMHQSRTKVTNYQKKDPKLKGRQGHYVICNSIFDKERKRIKHYTNFNLKKQQTTTPKIN